MKIAFLTEMSFTGKVLVDHPNMRTEFAWMHALNADHHNIRTSIAGYDVVVVIFPKGRVFLDASGSELSKQPNPVSDLLSSSFIDKLKQTNKRVFYMQEGPHWWFNDYRLADQINFYNIVASCDGIFAHNQSDALYYRGLYPGMRVSVMPTLMIEDGIADIQPKPDEKVMIGGNFARWYGGFESYMIAQEFDVPIWGQTSHAMRDGEEQLFSHLPRMTWVDWIKSLSTFKYAVHLMPTVAAGTFSLNCAYLGIPCIGNVDVDTQRTCHPQLSVSVNDIEQARKLAIQLREDEDFYKQCSVQAQANYSQHYNIDAWRSKINLK